MRKVSRGVKGTVLLTTFGFKSCQKNRPLDTPLTPQTSITSISLALGIPHFSRNLSAFAITSGEYT